MSVEQTPTISAANRSRRLMALPAAVTAAGLIVSACASQANNGSGGATKAPVDHCSTTYKRPLPSAANVNNYKDDRHGKVYPCWYLMDMDIPTGEEMPLSKMGESTFDVSHFRANSSFGGWLFLGSGTGGGHSTSEGSSTQKDVYAMQIQGTDGSYQKVVIDSESVRLKPCADQCKPTVSISVAEQPLFDKHNNNHSIWYAGNPKDQYNKSDYGWNWYNTVSQVSNMLPRETTVSDVAHRGTIGGGPKTPGAVISALANRIVVTLPEDILNNPTAIGSN